ncbi:MAG: ATP-binding protein, partial [Candidatus Brockarchaeota archaeon]|nr:ATP-binding protein [Candidatus Brockarchaeota archaeon]
MELRYIRDYLISFQRRLFPRIIERELKVKLVKGKAVVIIGPRRSGKTYYFFHIISRLNRNETVYLDFEEPFLKGLKPLDVLKILLEIFPEVSGTASKNVFLDEVQNAESWETLVRSLLNRNLNVFITGSSSRLLSREIATELRGRSVSYLLLPFSFREYLVAKNINIEPGLLEDFGRVKRELRNYLEEGGFPEIVLEEEKERILREYMDMVFFKDFVERHKVRSMTLARLLFNHIMQNFSREMSVRSLERKLASEGTGFNIGTLYRYVENLEDTVFIFFLRKFSLKAHERETWPRKVYLADTGLTRVFRISLDYGRLMENIVFLHLLRKLNKNPLLNFYYWKDNQQNEVDFMIKEGLKIKQLIQVTYASGRDEIERRETRALAKAAEQLKCKDLLMITWDLEDELKVNNKTIKCTPLWKWL